MLVIPEHIYRQMVEHAREDYPLEACGILGGDKNGVVEIHRMTNTDRSGVHFAMEPREQFAVVKELRSKGLRILAVYHSHPSTPARPSEEDIRLAFTPGISYVIVSLKDLSKPDVRSFHIGNGQVTSEDLSVIP